MTANGAGGATSKVSQKATRAVPVMADTQSKAKPLQKPRDPTEVATMPNEEPATSGAAVYNAEWTPHEQAALDQAAVKFPAERFQPFERYVRIAAALPRKGVRDVALRLRWLSQARKRKVSEEGPNKRLRRDRCQSIFATSQKAPNVMGQWPQQQVPMPQLDDHGAQTVGAVGGLVAQLLEQNLHILYQYKQNMHQFKVQENTELLVRFRDNILAVLNQMNSMDGVMSQMPQLPVRMNVELANNFLPAASGASPMFPLGMPGMPPGMGGSVPPPPLAPMTGYPSAEPVMGAVASMPNATGQFTGQQQQQGQQQQPQQQQQQQQQQQHQQPLQPQHSNSMPASPGKNDSAGDSRKGFHAVLAKLSPCFLLVSARLSPSMRFLDNFGVCMSLFGMCSICIVPWVTYAKHATEVRSRSQEIAFKELLSGFWLLGVVEQARVRLLPQGELWIRI